MDALPEIYCITLKKEPGGDFYARVEQLLSPQMALDIADDLLEEGLYGEAIVYRAQAASARAAGKQAFWDFQLSCPARDLEETLHQAFRRADKHNNTYIYVAKDAALNEALTKLNVKHDGKAAEIEALMGSIAALKERQTDAEENTPSPTLSY